MMGKSYHKKSNRSRRKVQKLQGHAVTLKLADGTGWATKNAYDSTFNGGGWEWGTGDCILAKFNLNGIDSIPLSEKY